MNLTTTTATDIANELLKLPQAEQELNHYFVDGMYCRELSLKANTLAVGKIHKKSAINILSDGVILVKASLDEDGVIVKAPATFITEAGSQKIVYCITPCTITNIFNTEATTPEEAEEDCTEPLSEETLELQRRNVWHLQYQQQ